MSRADEFTDALPEIALRLTQLSNERHVLDTAVEGLVNDFGAGLARVWLTGPPGRSRYRSMRLKNGSALRLKAQYLQRVNLDEEAARQVMAAKWILEIAESRIPISTSRLYHGGQTPDSGWMRQNGFRAFAGFPLVHGTVLMGVMAVFTRFPLDNRASKLLEVVAGQLVTALRSADDVLAVQEAHGLSIPSGSTLDEAMRIYIEHTLTRAKGKIEGPGGAAEFLGIHPNTLRSRMQKLGVRRV